MENLKWKSDKDLISYIESGSEYNEQELIKLLVERLKRATQPKYDETKGQFVARQVEDFINDMSCDEEGFISQVINKYHRTLQQKYFGLMLKTIEAIAKQEDYRIDGRNRYANLIAKSIIIFLEENKYPVGCPLI